MKIQILIIDAQSEKKSATDAYFMVYDIGGI